MSLLSENLKLYHFVDEKFETEFENVIKQKKSVLSLFLPQYRSEIRF